MNNQFARFELLIGEQALASLKKKKVAVFGLGGVGGNVCDALARSGIEHFTLIDNDVIDITNINRQLISNLNVLGERKVDVMERHLKSINKDIEVDKINMFYLPENAGEIDLSRFDYVVDAIDTVKSKIALIKKCDECHIPIISSMGAGNKVEPTRFMVADINQTEMDPLAKVIRRELRKCGIKHLKVVYSKEKPTKPQESISDEHKREIPGSSVFVVASCGLLIASEVIKDLINYED